MQANPMPGMSLHVHNQMVVSVEGPATLGALVRSLTSVDALVTEEVRGPAEGLAAVGTGRPALTSACVQALVQQQALPLREKAQALTAVVNLGGCWPPPHEGTPCQGAVAPGLLREAADDRARHHHFPWLQCRVAFPPCGGRASRSFPALFLHVRPLMDCQVNLQAEALPTVRAGEGPFPPAREYPGCLPDGPWWPRLPSPHPWHPLGVMPPRASSPVPRPSGYSTPGPAWGPQEMLLRHHLALRLSFCLDGHATTTWQRNLCGFKEETAWFP